MRMHELYALIDSLKPEPVSGCMLWPLPSRLKYPTVWMNNKEWRVSRVVLARKLGRPIQEGLFALHCCDNVKCVNPDHLREGTHQDNMQDMTLRGRAATGDRNAARLYPEKMHRGDQHYSRRTPEKLARGSRHGMTSLTEENVREIKKKWSTGSYTKTDLGREYGVNYRVISGIVRGLSWRHVV